MIRRILVAMLVLACGSAGAALYKWVDEKGVTHYTEEPPPDRKATKIEIRKEGPPAKADQPESWKDKEVEFRRRRLEKERQEETASAREKNEAARRENNCVRAREALDMLTHGRPIYRVNEKGERVYMEDAERDAETKRWRKEAETWCG
ncbi:MAG TPA: DUF4124 domain-containing protein [Usitatibacter sp.]|nr:DUF4124 domain-containing protein [Usitatibacter sp.]